MFNASTSNTGHRGISWREPPEYPILTRGAIHLWRIHLASLSRYNNLESILSTEEKAKYSRLVSAEKRSILIAARAALRLILSKYVRMLPRLIRFGYHEVGKPFLENSIIGADLRFNLSHSGEWMVLGICDGAELGIDIEEKRPLNHTWAVDNLFSNREQILFNKIPENEKNRAYIAIWTKKEATAKADGMGLGHYTSKQQSFSIPLKNHLHNTYAINQEGRFLFIYFVPVSGYIATAAVLNNLEPTIKFFDYCKQKVNFGISM